MSDPFHFYTRVHLPELTGKKARTAVELLEHLKTVSASVVYYHTHHFLQQHQFLNPEPPNDFAYWAGEALNEKELAERLASVNVCEYATLQELRDKIISVIQQFVQKPKRRVSEASEGHEFHFIKSVSFVFPTRYVANDLREFADALQHITIHSVYFHMFEARLRLEKGVNDFSNWFDTGLGEKELAKKVAKLDPYTHTVEGLRKTIIRLIENRIRDHEKAAAKGLDHA